MSGIGVAELLVITLVVALLFGAPILTFFVGYVVGKNKAATALAPEPAAVATPTPAPSPEDQPATPEEPTHE